MSRKTRWSRATVAVALGVGALAGIRQLRLATPSAGSRPAPPRPPASSQGGFAAELKGVATITIRDERDRRIWEFRAARIEVSEDEQVTRVFKLKKGTYFRNDRPSTTFTAEEVLYDARSKQLDIRGNVRATDVRGITISAPYVRWVEKERKFVCADEIRGEVRGLHFATRGVSLWPDSQRVVCENPVRAAGKNFSLRGRRLTADLKTERVEIASVTAYVRVNRNRPAAPEVVPPLNPSLLRRRT